MMERAYTRDRVAASVRMESAAHAMSSSKWYSWKPLLRRVEELAFRCASDWSVHHDADEIRRSPRPGENIESASRIWVFPAPFSPVSAMVLEPNRASSAA